MTREIPKERRKAAFQLYFALMSVLSLMLMFGRLFNGYEFSWWLIAAPILIPAAVFTSFSATIFIANFQRIVAYKMYFALMVLSATLLLIGRFMYGFEFSWILITAPIWIPVVVFAGFRLVSVVAE